MPIFRVLDSGRAILIDIPKDKENEFINNYFYKSKIVKVDSYPDSRFGCYIYDEEEGKIEVDIDKELMLLKQKKKKEIKDMCNKTLSSGFMCSFGFVIDCKPDDLLKLKCMLDYAKLNNISEITIRDFYNKTHTLSIDDFEKIVNELSKYVLGILYKKWSLQNSVDSAVTIDEVDNISWLENSLEVNKE